MNYNENIKNFDITENSASSKSSNFNNRNKSKEYDSKITEMTIQLDRLRDLYRIAKNICLEEVESYWAKRNRTPAKRRPVTTKKVRPKKLERFRLNTGIKVETELLKPFPSASVSRPTGAPNSIQDSFKAKQKSKYIITQQIPFYDGDRSYKADLIVFASTGRNKWKPVLLLEVKTKVDARMKHKSDTMTNFSTNDQNSKPTIHRYSDHHWMEQLQQFSNLERHLFAKSVHNQLSDYRALLLRNGYNVDHLQTGVILIDAAELQGSGSKQRLKDYQSNLMLIIDQYIQQLQRKFIVRPTADVFELGNRLSHFQHAHLILLPNQIEGKNPQDKLILQEYEQVPDWLSHHHTNITQASNSIIDVYVSPAKNQLYNTTFAKWTEHQIIRDILRKAEKVKILHDYQKSTIDQQFPNISKYNFSRTLNKQLITDLLEKNKSITNNTNTKTQDVNLGYLKISPRVLILTDWDQLSRENQLKYLNFLNESIPIHLLKQITIIRLRSARRGVTTSKYYLSNTLKSRTPILSNEYPLLDDLPKKRVWVLPPPISRKKNAFANEKSPYRIVVTETRGKKGPPECSLLYVNRLQKFLLDRRLRLTDTEFNLSSSEAIDLIEHFSTSQYILQNLSNQKDVDKWENSKISTRPIPLHRYTVENILIERDDYRKISLNKLRSSKNRLNNFYLHKSNTLRKLQKRGQKNPLLALKRTGKALLLSRKRTNFHDFSLYLDLENNYYFSLSQATMFEINAKLLDKIKLHFQKKKQFQNYNIDVSKVDPEKMMRISKNLKIMKNL
jgi:hypothetical protein